jgi:voltage-gated potassium channel
MRELREFEFNRWGAFARLARRYDAVRRVLERRIRLNRWFPHVPLGLALVPLGIFLSYRAIFSVLGWNDAIPALEDLEIRLLGAHLSGLSDFVIGGLLIVTAFGLFLRSRTAWWLAVVALTTSVTLNLFSNDAIIDATDWILVYRAILLAWLLFNRAHFSARSISVQSALGVYVVVMFLVCATVLTLRRGSHFEPEVHDLITALYFVVMTISTVGFGDIVPRDPETRGFVMSMILIGVLLIGSTISVFLIPLMTNRLRTILGHREDPVNRTKHFIVIGTSSLARNAAVELEKRGQNVTLILSAANEDAFFHDRDVVIGDATDLEVLRTAGTNSARGVLALSGDDATNGFIVLGVNELNPSILTVAALNDPKNQSRVERTQPSILLSLQVLGGQLLAMALTGETVDEDFLESVLKIQGVPAAGADPEVV